MKALITEVKYVGQFNSKFGILHNFAITYEDKRAKYTSKSKEQKFFKVGEMAEFTEETKTATDQNGMPYTYMVIKPVTSAGASNFGRALKKEQSRYSGFAMAYAKDLVVAGIIKYEDMFEEAEAMFNIMVALDKKLES